MSYKSERLVEVGLGPSSCTI